MFIDPWKALREAILQCQKDSSAHNIGLFCTSAKYGSWKIEPRWFHDPKDFMLKISMTFHANKKQRVFSVLGLIELTLKHSIILGFPCPVELSKFKNVPNLVAYLVRHIATLTTSNAFSAYRNNFHEAVSFSHTLKMLSSSWPFLWGSVAQILMYQQHISRYFFSHRWLPSQRQSEGSPRPTWSPRRMPPPSEVGISRSKCRSFRDTLNIQDRGWKNSAFFGTWDKSHLITYYISSDMWFLHPLTIRFGWLDDHQLYLAQNLIRCPRKHASSGPRLAPPDIGPQAAKWDGSPTATSMNWVNLSHSPWFLLKIHPTPLIHPCGKLWRAPCGIQDLSTKTAKEFLGAATWR